MFITTDDVIEVQENTQVNDKDKLWCVYCHTNLINNKKYIGITSQNPKYRWSNGNGYKKQQYFWRAIQKYGWDNFKHEILFENLIFDDACNLEQELIKQYQTNNKLHGYNVTDGGAGTQGHILTEEQKQVISNKAKERFENPENHPMYGKHLSDETKQKISKALTGKYVKEANPNTGRKHTEEERIKISQNRKGKNCGEDNYLYGKHLTDETKSKLSAKAKERLSDPKNHPMYGKHMSDDAKKQISDKNKLVWIDKCIPVYSIEIDSIFQGATDVHQKMGLDVSAITKCCKGKLKHAGRHPVTNERLQWLYVYDQVQKDGSVIHGAITLGYITEERVNNYLESLKAKEIDVNGKTI